MWRSRSCSRSGINVFLVFIPVAWVAHFMQWHKVITFARALPLLPCRLAIVLKGV